MQSGSNGFIGFNRTQSDALGVNCFHWIPLDSMWFHKIQLDSIINNWIHWIHLDSIRLSWIWLAPLDSVRFSWIQLVPLHWIGYSQIGFRVQGSVDSGFRVQGSIGFGVQGSVDSFGWSWIQLDSIRCNWIQVVASDSTGFNWMSHWMQSGSVGFKRFHYIELDSVRFIWIQLVPLRSIRLNWFRWDSIGFTGVVRIQADWSGFNGPIGFDWSQWDSIVFFGFTSICDLDQYLRSGGARRNPNGYPIEVQ